MIEQGIVIIIEQNIMLLLLTLEHGFMIFVEEIAVKKLKFVRYQSLLDAEKTLPGQRNLRKKTKLVIATKKHIN